MIFKRETPENDCKNNYNDESYKTNFAATESAIKICNRCGHFKYEDGIMTCDKFGKENN